jgi:hypothetical protein
MAAGGVLTKATPAFLRHAGRRAFSRALSKPRTTLQRGASCREARATAQKARDQQKKLSNKARSLADRIKTL